MRRHSKLQLTGSQRRAANAPRSRSTNPMVLWQWLTDQTITLGYHAGSVTMLAAVAHPTHKE
jgi:hypothetical protein